MVIEKAAEIHVIDSSFLSLIDCLQYENKSQKLYFHKYAREYGKQKNNEWVYPVLRKDWQIITNGFRQE